jgi:hypothetical protein
MIGQDLHREPLSHSSQKRLEWGTPAFVAARVAQIDTRSRAVCSSWFSLRFKEAVDCFDGEGALALQNYVATSGNDGQLSVGQQAVEL